MEDDGRSGNISIQFKVYLHKTLNVPGLLFNLSMRLILFFSIINP